MKHAFLIIAHNNWWQLKQLIKALDYESNDIYVHIDKKSRDFNEYEFKGITKYSTVSFYQQFDVYWGGYSQVQVEMYMIEVAYRVGYDYYHFISGADIPLKSNEKFYDFFKKNQGYEFIDFDDRKLISDPEISRRIQLYHYLQNYRRKYNQKIFNDFYTFCERVLLVLQIVLGIDRTKNLKWTIKYGSNWVSITNSLVEELLRQKDSIHEIFHYTNCADELFVQTVAYNCGFKSKIYKPENQIQMANMRLIDWERGNNGNPYTFTINDMDILKNSNALFARKFSEQIDKIVIEEIIAER
jgi:hypothetical protein